MALFKRIALVLVLGLAMIGCGPSSEEAPVTEPAAPAEEPAAPEPEPVTLPEGFPAAVHLYPEMVLTEVEVIDAEKLQYAVVGESRSSVYEVLEYYEEYFPKNGWEEDMIMSQKGITVISFYKDGLMEYVEAKEGGYGCYVTITTGAF